jgi:hypothetical protein
VKDVAWKDEGLKSWMSVWSDPVRASMQWLHYVRLLMESGRTIIGWCAGLAAQRCRLEGMAA